MASSRILHLILFFSSSLLLAPLASSSSSSSSAISYDAIESRPLMGRSLLQQKQACTVDLENQNYTIVTSKCKGPNYPAKDCCDSFKQLACPFSEQLNDETNNCATTLFSYINLYGKYPPGLFASLCKEGKEGLDCSNITSTAQNSTSDDKNSAPGMFGHSLFLMLSATFLVLAFNLF